MTYDYKDYIKIKEKFYNDNTIDRNKINSFNNFIEQQLPSLILQKNPIIIKEENSNTTHKIYFTYNHVNNGPKKYIGNQNTVILTPQMCRLFNDTYGVDVFVNYSHETYSGTQLIKKYEHPDPIKFCSIPILVGSKLCHTYKKSREYIKSIHEDPNDLKGYYIVNGLETIIVSQEHKTNNMLFVNPSKTGYICFIQSKPHRLYDYPYKTHVSINMKNEITINFIVTGSPKDTQGIPLDVVFKALGASNDKEIFNYICGGNEDDVITSTVYGILSEKTIKKKDGEDKFLKGIGIDINLQSAAIMYIARKTGESLNEKELDPIKKKDQYQYFTNTFINKKVLPHLGDDLHKKKLFLGYMVNTLIKVKNGILPVNNRQMYGNKRIIGVGTQMIHLIRHLYKKMIGEFTREVLSGFKTLSTKKNKDEDSMILNHFKSDDMSEKIVKAIAVGNWPGNATKSGQNVRTGITSRVERKSYSDTIASLCKIVASISSSNKSGGKSKDISLYDSSQIKVISPNETPDGSKTGIQKEVAMSVDITQEGSFTQIYDLLDEMCELGSPKIDSKGNIKFNGKDKFVIVINEFPIEKIDNSTKIMINGDWNYITYYPKLVRERLVNFRRENIIEKYTEITCDFIKNEIRIFTDDGRCCMPMFIVDHDIEYETDKNGNAILTAPKKVKQYLRIEKIEWQNMTWNELCMFKNGKGPYIEYVDIHELDCNCIIAKDVEELRRTNPLIKLFTHCDIHPSFNVSYNGNVPALFNFNPGPRNTFGYSQMKQAVGIPVCNYWQRQDNTLHVLENPEIPIVNTYDGTLMGWNDRPGGFNAIVAIRAFTGYNIEDAIILNRDSANRGMGVMTKFLTVESKAKETNSEKFMKPIEETTQDFRSDKNYSAIRDDGLPLEGKIVNKGDYVIGKVAESIRGKKDNGKKYIDRSEEYKGDDGSIISFIHPNFKGKTNMKKVTLRSRRVPKIGDKFSTNSAQKGTVSCCRSSVDMPFTKDGIVPDMIMNPHSIPSRMTQALILGMCMGKYGAYKGHFMDGSGFSNIKYEEIIEQLKSIGLNSFGKEILYDPLTGKAAEHEIFIGVTYYQRLWQMVNDKVHIRAPTGRVDNITRQPISGKAASGGVKFGFMENDALLAHGISSLQHELSFDKSDSYECYVCKHCGTIQVGNRYIGKFFCKFCDNHNDFAKVKLNYTSKLLIYEMYSMGIKVKIRTEKKSI